ncbi:MAG TPA: hypothetical protein RMH99_02600 [Sandaracinaceae bacterium LLY-WYZ-13_1]|nr:hypothetical protein [Sandaracinaceae bacterium LLY-WYZ-13_1]
MRRTGTSLILTAALAALAATALAPSPGRGQAGSLERFDGTWTLTSGRRALDDAIDRVADRMNVFIREIARGEMHRRLSAERRVRLVVHDEEHVSLGFDDWGPVRLRLDGPARSVRGPEGDGIRLSMHLARGRLIAHQDADQGDRTSVFAVSGDGEHLSMGVRIGADQLPADIRYRLRYRRTR